MGRWPALVLTALVVGAIALDADQAWGDQPTPAFAFSPCSYRPAASQADCRHLTDNFVVRTSPGGPRAHDVARHCERICAQLRGGVFGIDPSARWNPKCTIVVHPTRSAYLAAVGQNGSQTVGSSTVSFTAGRVRERRIDLLGIDAAKALAAIPHELVHVLFADALPLSAPPKWAEEGLALLADAPDKRARHRGDLRNAIDSRTLLPVTEILSNDRYPASSRRAAFYAQSLSLADYLVRRDSPAKFVEFAKLATEQNAAHALHDIYQLEPAELENEWRNHITSSRLATAR